LQILTVSRDRRLHEELRQILETFEELCPVIRAVVEPLRVGDAARTWRPQVALVEMPSDLSGLTAITTEIHAASPETIVVGVFQSDPVSVDSTGSGFLIQAIRTGVRDFVRRPISRADVGQMLERIHSGTNRVSIRPATIVSFISNKGGVGKTTLAVNTAIGLAHHAPERVLLIDGSLQIGLCAPQLGLKPRTSLLDAVRERDRLDETLIRQLTTRHESGLDLLAAPADAIEATEIDDDFIARILTLARRAYDYVVVDTFPIFDRTVMTVLDLSDRAFIVLDNLVPTVLAVSRLLHVLDGLKLDSQRQRLVLNRVVNVFGGLQRDDIEGKIGRPIDYLIPYHRAIMSGGNIGVPFLSQRHPFSGTDRKLRRLIQDIVELHQVPMPLRVDHDPEFVPSEADRAQSVTNLVNPSPA